jgi:hypothetical protein
VSDDGKISNVVHQCPGWGFEKAIKSRGKGLSRAMIALKLRPFERPAGRTMKKGTRGALSCREKENGGF